MCKNVLKLINLGSFQFKISLSIFVIILGA